MILVEVDDMYALIDKENGLIHVLTAENAELYRCGLIFDCESTHGLLCCATSGHHGHHHHGHHHGWDLLEDTALI